MNTLTKKAFALVLSLSLLGAPLAADIRAGVLFAPASVNALEYNGFTYETGSDGNITITGYTGSSASVAVPASIGSSPVTAIGASAFANNITITSVTIPSGVTAIGSRAFYMCPLLKAYSYKRPCILCL